ncbi:DUF1307 domain-containing protein [Streptococcus sp. CSL10205-OR2]|uniref:DUF1307 domain-containing protein n=1 Tax=Streptococcus sp. CSL10205-OR2 TaxID=2980558 RepID=UPI0021DA2A52|nr:DUF1307 domain-containing protein [Streptococcus sp. CSL10205-OR2]MCU9533619.1 DUF1307 domain-containing protein [Streptococcus sp. CSL10205-OR2]
MKKKKWLVVLLATIMFLLTACGSKEKEIASIGYQNSIPGRDIRYIFYYEKGTDKIVKQESITTFSYQAFGVASKEEAKELLDPLSKDYENLKGVTETVEYEKDYFREKITVDYLKINLKQLKDDERFEIEEENADYFSLAKSTKGFRNENSGFVEVRDGHFKDFQP